MQTAVIQVTGSIQEVGYLTIVSLAQVLGVNGYVRNIPDDNVEIIAQTVKKHSKNSSKKINIQYLSKHILKYHK